MLIRSNCRCHPTPGSPFSCQHPGLKDTNPNGLGWFISGRLDRKYCFDEEHGALCIHDNAAQDTVFDKNHKVVVDIIRKYERLLRNALWIISYLERLELPSPSLQISWVTVTIVSAWRLTCNSTRKLLIRHQKQGWWYQIPSGTWRREKIQVI